jgi:predicted aldo/keto reductase-like oxidoreductase
LRGHASALEELHRLKAAGIIRAAGISTHYVAGVLGAVEYGGFDVIHPLINITGIGIADGGRAEMEAALKKAYDSDIGIFAMKVFGGGNLLRDPGVKSCLDYIESLDCVHSYVLGMQSREEVDANVEYAKSGQFSAEFTEALGKKDRRLLIEPWCHGCGKCLSSCAGGALSVSDGKAVCDNSRCVLCGYCAAACPDFIIKVV